MEISFVQGDTWEFDVVFKNLDDSDYELHEGDEVWFKVKRSWTDPECEISVVQDNPHFKIPPEQTNILAGKHYCDIGIIFSNGDIVTVIPEIVLIVRNKVQEYGD